MSKFEKMKKDYQDILDEFIALDREVLNFDIGRINGVMEYAAHLPDKVFENEIIHTQLNLLQWEEDFASEA